MTTGEVLSRVRALVGIGGEREADAVRRRGVLVCEVGLEGRMTALAAMVLCDLV